jgi:hypothetical protein
MADSLQQTIAELDALEDLRASRGYGRMMAALTEQRQAAFDALVTVNAADTAAVAKAQERFAVLGDVLTMTDRRIAELQAALAKGD